MKEKTMKLTIDNYHSQEANKLYMSVSQFNGWLKCPAAQHAQIFGKRVMEEKVYFEIGSYIDCQLLTPERYPQWYDEHLDALIETGCISKKDKTTKNAVMRDADEMIARALRDEYFMSFLKGDHQRIITFPFAGVNWKIMIDSLDKTRLVDLKTTKSITAHDWIDRRTVFELSGIEDDSEFIWTKGPFYEIHNYWRQFAVYQYGVEYADGVRPDPFIAALSKESPPDAAIIHFGNDHRIHEELGYIEQFMKVVSRWKSGDEPPIRCGRCEYCRETKVLSAPVEAVSMNVAV